MKSLAIGLLISALLLVAMPVGPQAAGDDWPGGAMHPTYLAGDDWPGGAMRPIYLAGDDWPGGA